MQENFDDYLEDYCFEQTYKVVTRKVSLLQLCLQSKGDIILAYDPFNKSTSTAKTVISDLIYYYIEMKNLKRSRELMKLYLKVEGGLDISNRLYLKESEYTFNSTKNEDVLARILNNLFGNQKDNGESYEI